MLKSPKKIRMPFVGKWVSDIDWRVLLIIASPLSLLLLFSLSLSSSPFISLQRQFLLLSHGGAGGENSSSLSALPAANDEYKQEILRSRIAVCLVGGARRFELTGPSIIKMILSEYPNSDLFLNSPYDVDSFKFLLFKNAPNNIAAFRIFHPQPLPENDSQIRLLTPNNSPNGIQVVGI